MKTALIIFGGVSSEHEVSLRSAQYVIKSIPKDKYTVLLLGITKQGKWLFFNGSEDLLPDSSWERHESVRSAVLSPDLGTHNLLVFDGETFTAKAFDVVFPVLHGKNGEDGTIQGLLQLYGVPFVGAGCRSSAVCMDKIITNLIADSKGIPQAKWVGVEDYEFRQDEQGFLDRAALKLGFPIFVKPANAGSSVGVGKANDMNALRECMENALKHDRRIVLEEAIVGKEVECSVLGTASTQTGVVGEIEMGKAVDFYSYDAKYIDNATTLHVPARINDTVTALVKKRAVQIYNFLEVRELARVDFFVRENDGEVLFNEINTLPGFTSASLYSRMMMEAGIPTPQLVDTMLTLALENIEK